MPFDLHSILLFAAKLLFGGAFVVFGIRNVQNVPRLTGILEARKTPQAQTLIYIGIMIQIVGGVAVALSPWPWAGAIALIAFLLLAAYLFHPYWEYAPADQGPHIYAWIMNVGLSGGMLLLVAAAV